MSEFWNIELQGVNPLQPRNHAILTRNSEGSQLFRSVALGSRLVRPPGPEVNTGTFHLRRSTIHTFVYHGQCGTPRDGGGGGGGRGVAARCTRTHGIVRQKLNARNELHR